MGVQATVSWCYHIQSDIALIRTIHRRGFASANAAFQVLAYYPFRPGLLVWRHRLNLEA